MIEFYNKYFKKNYKSKVNQLIIDINRLLLLENISVERDNNIILDSSFRDNLEIETWIEVNNLYNTLFYNKHKISNTLLKFINKTNSNQQSEFQFIDTFAGCGGLSLGLTNSGFNPVMINDIEPRFLETYYYNHDIHLDSYFCGDIKCLLKNRAMQEKYKDIDLIVGGPPCQGFSMANRQRIIDDPRNKLYKYFLRLLTNMQPKFFIMENVKGMVKKTEEIISDFKSALGREYSVEIVLLNAKDFGVPQNRERVFVIGSRLLPVPASLIISDVLAKKTLKQPFKLKDALYGLPNLQPKEKKNTKGIENNKIGFKFRINSSKTNIFMKNINNNMVIKYISNHTNRYNNDRDIEIYSRLPQGANSLHSSIKDIMPYSSRNNIFKDKYFKLQEDDFCKTITSHMKMDCNMYIHPTESRGLSPREAARVQTFPDDFVFMGSNNTWYAQIGNAVPVVLSKTIGNEIVKYLR